MSQDYSNSHEVIEIIPEKSGVKYHNLRITAILSAWFLASFFIAQLLLVGLVWLLNILHIPISSLNSSVSNALLSVILYILTFIFLVLPSLLIGRSSLSKDEIGYSRFPSWTDILITPAGLIIYLIFSSLLMLLATHMFTWIDTNQVQNTGFNNLNQNYQYILAFVTLVIIAPVAEETLFRGYLYGKLKKYMPFWVAIVVTSVLFGAIHGQWDLAIDTFALSIVLCFLRESTGSIWASILLHMTKNGIAFYFLFINPLLLSIMIK